MGADRLQALYLEMFSPPPRNNKFLESLHLIQQKTPNLWLTPFF